MEPNIFRLLVAVGSIFALSACASLSATSRIKNGLISLGVSAPRSECMADRLADDLDRRDLNDVADFLDGLNEAETPGNALDALLRIDNPRAAAAIAGAGVSCALGG